MIIVDLFTATTDYEKRIYIQEREKKTNDLYHDKH